MDKTRLEAFSDGVFAVAITLLALNLTVAGPGHESLVRQVVDRWPSFLAFVVSFFAIGIAWVNHHSLFKSIATTDRTLLFLNLTLLLFIVAIPFGTATMATYLQGGGADAPLAAALYAALLEGMALSFAAIFVWSIGDGKRRYRPLPARGVGRALVRFSIGTLAYLVAIALAFVNAVGALAFITAVAIYYVVEHNPSTSAEGPTRTDQGGRSADSPLITADHADFVFQ